MSHLVGNVVNEAKVETKTESVVGEGQDPRYRGRGETIVRKDRGAGAERDDPVGKGDCNGAEHCLFLPL